MGPGPGDSQRVRLGDGGKRWREGGGYKSYSSVHMPRKS